MMARVLFICTGNICRSPTAEGVFRHLVERAGLADTIHIDSAGTHDYHVGNPPDARAQAAAARRGYSLSGLRARQVADSDFAAFDFVLAMDEHNRSHVRRNSMPGCDCSWNSPRVMFRQKCRIPTTAARRVSSRCSIWSKTPRRAC
jgi:protein-tyrosine-phosphatase